MAKSFFSFTDEQNNPASPNHAIFPIFCHRNGETVLLGTGFYISSAGIFVTAKHIFEDEIPPFFSINFLNDNEYMIRGINKIISKEQLALSNYEPSEGELLSTYAFPHTLVNKDIDTDTTNVKVIANNIHGTVIQSEPKGFGIVKGKVLVADMTNKGGSSGGPVFTPSAKGVIGLNSSGSDSNYFVISLISQIRDLVIDGVCFQNKTNDLKIVTIDELIKLGYIKVI